jgi:predicted nuclease of predicted toxin-antitoxin system
LLGALDDAIMRAAVGSERVLITADTDFGELLAVSGDRLPSIVLLRVHGHEPTEQVGALRIAIEAVTQDLASGAIVVVTDRRLRVRRLPDPSS